MVNAKLLNRIIPLTICEHKCSLCAFYDAASDNRETGLCFFNKEGCPKKEDARPTTSQSSCESFMHTSLQTLTSIAERLENGGPLIYDGVRELSDEQKTAIDNELNELIVKKQRVKLSEYVRLTAPKLHVQRDLFRLYLLEKIDAKQLGFYEQRGVVPQPAHMICAIDNIPDFEERELVRKHLLNESRERRKERLARERALMTSEGRMSELDPTEAKAKARKRVKRFFVLRHVSKKL